MVLFAHCIEQSSPPTFELISRFVHLGAGGVYLFFLVSGFVIPMSLNRVKSVREFIIGRAFRIYPLFLASLGIALLTTFVGVRDWMDAKPLWSSSLLNLTMLQEFLGFPSLVGSYWTLGYEMVFYVLVGALLAVGVQKRLYRLSFLLSSLYTLLIALAIETGKSYGGDRLVGFVFMFLGSAFYAHQTGSLSSKRLVGLSAFAMLSLSAHWILSIKFNSHTLATWAHISTAWLAFLGFIFALRLSDRRIPNLLVYLGAISYSVYLVHGIVLFWILPKAALSNPIVHLAVVTTVTLLISSATYRWIEQPGIQLGRRLVKRD